MAKHQAEHQTEHQTETPYLHQPFLWRAAFMSKHGPHPTTRHVLHVLHSFMNRNDSSCWPSVKTIAKQTGLARSTVWEHLELACKQGWLKKETRRLTRESYKSNLYHAVIPEKAGGVVRESGKVIDIKGGVVRVSGKGSPGIGPGVVRESVRNKQSFNNLNNKQRESSGQTPAGAELPKNESAEIPQVNFKKVKTKKPKSIAQREQVVAKLRKQAEQILKQEQETQSGQVENKSTDPWGGLTWLEHQLKLRREQKEKGIIFNEKDFCLTDNEIAYGKKMRQDAIQNRF